MKYFALLLLIVLPVTSFANHGSSRIDRDDLDDDVVEEFPIPLLFAVDYTDVVPDFGAPRGGGTREHEGQDFMAPKGTPIVTPTDAIVIGTGVWSGGGNYVQTANPGGETFRYMHLDEVADLDPGDELDAGDYIGTVGDTGNAGEGVYHLHFEVLDEDGDPVDPFGRLGEEFDLEDQINFLDNLFSSRRDDADYAKFLVETFPEVFTRAVAEDIDLPRSIEGALKDTDIVDQVADVADLTDLIESIPALVQVELETGDQGVFVALLQIYLIYGSEGTERDQLAAAGPTGYYGGITAAAVESLQDELRITESGIYNKKTQQEFAERDLDTLNLR